MNTGIFGEGFPYSNFHDLNMDWIIKIAKDFLDQYTHIQQIIEQGQEDIANLTAEELQALSDKKDELEELLNQWYTTHSNDIANQLATALASLNTALQNATTAFNTSATTKTQELLADIPSDYTDFYDNTIYNIGELQRGKNLYNAKTTTLNKEINSEGQIVDSTSCLSDYIPVLPLPIVFSIQDQLVPNYRVFYVSEFDKDKTFIRRNTVSTLTQFTPAEDAVYIRLTIASNTVNTLMVEYFGMSTFMYYYTPFDIGKTIGSGVKSDYWYLGQNLFNDATVTNLKEYNSEGEIVDSAVVSLSDFIPVLRNTTYYMSLKDKEVPNYRIYYIVEFDNKKNFLRRITTTTATTYTPSYDAMYCRLEISNTYVPFIKFEIAQRTPWSKYLSSYQMVNSILEAGANLFDSICGVGDSYTAGLCSNQAGTEMIEKPEQSYIAVMGKRAGVDWYINAISGCRSETFINLPNGLAKLLSEPARGLYIINIGQNDINNGTTVGSLDDIHQDPTTNPNTYYGNMGRIISDIHSHAPNAKIILVKSWINHNIWGTDTSYQMLDGDIEIIANYFGIPFIAPFDDQYFNSWQYQNKRVQGHPTILGYTMMGFAMERLLSKCICENYDYFMYSTIG